MARLTSVRFTQAVLGEAKLRLIGPAPGAVGRFTFMDDVGTTYGQTNFTAFSKRTWGLMNALKASMEEDFVRAIAEADVQEDEEAEASNAFDEPEDLLGESTE